MLTPIKAIRKWCLSCQESCSLVRYCDDTECPLFPYRMGNNPKRKGIGRKKSNPTQETNT